MTASKTYLLTEVSCLLEGARRGCQIASLVWRFPALCHHRSPLKRNSARALQQLLPYATIVLLSSAIPPEHCSSSGIFKKYEPQVHEQPRWLGLRAVFVPLEWETSGSFYPKLHSWLATRPFQNALVAMPRATQHSLGTKLVLPFRRRLTPAVILVNSDPREGSTMELCSSLFTFSQLGLPSGRTV